MTDPQLTTLNATSRFSYVDGFEDTSFFAEPLVHPWRDNQPDNHQAEESCVEWTLRRNQQDWNDFRCGRSLHFICRTENAPGKARKISPIVAAVLVAVGVAIIECYLLRCRDEHYSSGGGLVMFFKGNRHSDNYSLF